VYFKCKKVEKNKRITHRIYIKQQQKTEQTTPTKNMIKTNKKMGEKTRNHQDNNVTNQLKPY